MRHAWAGLLAIVTACSFDPSGGDEPSIDAPLDPIDAAPDDSSAVPDAAIDAIAIDAMPACVAGCDVTNTVLTTCGPSGPVIEVCAQGCSLTPGPHCRVFSPSNGATSADLAGVTAALDVSPGRLFVLDTADGSIDSFDSASVGTPPLVVRAAGDGVVSGISFRRPDQAGRPGLAIWGVTTVTVNGGASIALHGTLRFVGPRAAIVLARGAITVTGAIDASAGHTAASFAPCRECAGPGGGGGGTRAAVATGCAPGGNGVYHPNTEETGGAGGGMSTPGANGGDATALGGEATAITSCPDATLIPLQGGSGGGRGGYDSTGTPIGGVVGGGGGGALQLTSLTSLTISGIADVYAGGLGGEGSELWYGGGGGGGGGAILLEAPFVTIGGAAKVTANGGGGGSGRTANVGDAGNRSASRAAGGSGDGPGMNDGRGGRGGVAADLATLILLQTEGRGGVDGTGGGGASAGRIRVNASAAIPPTITATVVSPTASIGTRPID